MPTTTEVSPADFVSQIDAMLAEDGDTDPWALLEQIGAEEGDYVTLPNGRTVPAKTWQRVQMCQKLCEGTNATDGTLRQYHYHCGKHLYCPHCAAYRAKIEKELMVSATGGIVRVYHAVTDVDDKRMVRQIRDTTGAQSYRRYPQADGTSVIVHMNHDLPGEVTDAEDMDWLAITQTPEGKNVSGKLRPTCAAPKDKHEEPVTVTEEFFHIEAAHGQMTETEIEERKQRAWDLAVLKTSHLEPVDRDTLQMCIRERNRAWRLQLEDVGLAITFVTRHRRRVDLETLDWHDTNEKATRKTNPGGIVFETAEQGRLWYALFGNQRSEN